MDNKHDIKNMDLYEILEIDKKADEATIKTAYKKQALKWHPDKNPDNKEQASEKFKLVCEAYTILSNQERREKYDKYGLIDEEDMLDFDDFMGDLSSIDEFLMFLAFDSMMMHNMMGSGGIKGRVQIRKLMKGGMPKDFPFFMDKTKKKNKKKEEEDEEWETEEEEEEGEWEDDDEEETSNHKK